MNRTTISVAIVVLPGLLALFLPFAKGISPLDVVLKSSDLLYASLLRLALPLFLAVIIAMWMLRRLFVDRMSAVEVVLAYILSSSAMLAILTVTFELHSDNTNTGLILSLGVTWVVSLLNVMLLVRNIIKHRKAEDIAEAFLLAGYLPTALFCLIVYSPLPQVGSFIIHEQSGAVAVAIACVAYITKMVLLLRHTGKETVAAFQKSLQPPFDVDRGSSRLKLPKEP